MINIHLIENPFGWSRIQAAQVERNQYYLGSAAKLILDPIV